MGVSVISTEATHGPRAEAGRECASLPIPFGWFALANARDLAPGDVRPLFFFDEHLVLFRTEDGEAHVTGAFCPHLGAHLGHGGTIEGNALVCPFHGWRFDGAGACVGVPYARSMPPRATVGACLRSYPVLERNRMIWAWYHPRRVPPLFDLDVVPELDDPDWSEPDCYEWEVETPIQEAGENAVDVAHFVTVHGAAEMPKARITLVGHRRDTQLTCAAPAINEDGTIDLTRTMLFELVTRNCGAGMSVQSFDFGARAVMLGTVDAHHRAAHEPAIRLHQAGARHAPAGDADERAGRRNRAGRCSRTSRSGSTRPITRTRCSATATARSPSTAGGSGSSMTTEIVPVQRPRSWRRRLPAPLAAQPDRVILDTHVLIGATLLPAGQPRRVLDAVRQETSADHNNPRSANDTCCSALTTR